MSIFDIHFEGFLVSLTYIRTSSVQSNFWCGNKIALQRKNDFMTIFTKLLTHRHLLINWKLTMPTICPQWLQNWRCYIYFQCRCTLYKFWAFYRADWAGMNFKQTDKDHPCSFKWRKNQYTMTNEHWSRCLSPSAKSEFERSENEPCDPANAIHSSEICSFY